MTSNSSDQSVSMSDSDDAQNEADTSFLDEDFLSFSAQDNGGSTSNSSRKRSRSNSPVPSYNDRNKVSVPWLVQNGSQSHQHQSHQGRGYNNYHEPSQLIKLHNEIVSFVKLMEPTNEELKVRDQMVERVTDLAKRTFGKRVLPFGSQVTGLCLPNSDIDFVIRFPEKNVKSKSKINDINIDNKDDEEDEHPRSNPLHTFANAVREEFGVKNESDTQTTDTEHLSYLEIIEQTRVPLVKFTIEPYNIDIDVCFDQPGGPESADLMHRFMSSMPPLRPLTFVLKYFLASRDINKPFTGGIGSYMLQLMIVSFLQHRSREERYRVGRIENVFNLGSLLVDFFEFYGADLNYLTTGISVRNDGFYFAKGERDKKSMFWQPGRPFSLAIENPLDTTMDVGAGAYRIQMIQRVFQHSYQTLLAYVAEPREMTDSILTRIIPPTAEMEKRRLHKLSLGDEGTVALTPEDKKNRKHLEERWKNPKNRNSEKRSSSGRAGVEKSSSKKHKRDRRDSAGSKSNRDKRHGR